MTELKGLDFFKGTLRQEHLEKVALLENQRDEEIADLFAERRLSFQSRTAALRKGHEDQFTLRTAEKRKKAMAQGRAFIFEELSKLHQSFTDDLQERWRELRRSDMERYSRALKNLADEALKACCRPAVLFVEEGGKALLEPLTEGDGLYDGVEIIETELKGWGGCRAETENEIVDNTLFTRWDKLSASFKLDLVRILNDSFQEINQRINEL